MGRQLPSSRKEAQQPPTFAVYGPYKQHPTFRPILLWHGGSSQQLLNSGVRKSIWLLKMSDECWHRYLRDLHNGPADATATLSSLASLKSRLV